MSSGEIALGIFAKFPQAGKVKTRIAQDLGAELTCELYRAFLRDTVSRFRMQFRNRCVVCFTPDTPDSQYFFHTLTGADDIVLWPQPEGNLGTRLRSFFEVQFQQGVEKVVVVGSDSPTLPASLVEESFEKLLDSDCVLGPAVDGGFYLLGMSKFVPEIFLEIDWSTTCVLKQIVSRLQEAEMSLSLLPPWYDVDSLDDLRFLRGHLNALSESGEKDLPQETLQFLDRYSTELPK